MGKRIIISRTDGIGDVMLCLPLAGVLKTIHPDATIVFLGSSYTHSIINCCKFVDEFVDWNSISEKPAPEQVQLFRAIKAEIFIHVFPNKKIASLAKKAGVPLRIGTYSRFYHLFSCNKLINLHRKNSPLHESQLNLKLLKPLGAKEKYTIQEISNYFGFEKLPVLSEKFSGLIDKEKFNLILHPKSKGSAREWGTNNYLDLINKLPTEKFKIFITGAPTEAEAVKPLITGNVVDLCGLMNLEELIAFIAAADGMIACSTGPLHIAAVLGKRAIGIYAPMRPIHPGRWMPVGKNASVLVKDVTCNQCRNDKKCQCIESISPQTVINEIMKTSI